MIQLIMTILITKELVMNKTEALAAMYNLSEIWYHQGYESPQDGLDDMNESELEELMKEIQGADYNELLTVLLTN